MPVGPVPATPVPVGPVPVGPVPVVVTQPVEVVGAGVGVLVVVPKSIVGLTVAVTLGEGDPLLNPPDFMILFNRMVKFWKIRLYIREN